MLAPTARQSRAFDIARAMALVVPTGLLAGALGSQFLGDLVPCEMCIWQRWPHAAAIVLAALAFIGRGKGMLLTGLAALAIAVSGAIGVAHVGVETGVLPPLTDCSAGGPLLTIEDIMAAPTVRCDQVQWSLLGISMAGWNAIVSLGAALLIALQLRKATR